MLDYCIMSVGEFKWSGRIGLTVIRELYSQPDCVHAMHDFERRRYFVG